ncbi:MAG: heme utilization cystosolic carrier protein HutX [Paracoccus sp. (in: a-proteobacteria)]|uniref:heme utilization cystosolic carrier protein HutX n=1 Tax=Paracoccus sp. TaxID=267 RepID=UPI0026DEC7FF|nr:heme utilization cystosolic carrier protein HutX [Paracoccus sp. (in: a-proteobacteria)]MDO5614543.1 heme utilization cystosolic carrier protein HutX [Paracoccus sp. (in: a-proteobacteria)]
MTTTADTMATPTLADAIAANPTAALEDIARAAGTTPLAVLEALPRGEVTHLPGSLMAEALDDIAHWGEITFIVNTGAVILEAKGPMHGGTVAHGMYNLKGKPISGHLSVDACARVAFVRRKLFSSETRSVQFYDHDGNCLFKVYLGRDAQRQLIPEQIAAFDTLEARLLAGA